MLVVATLSRKRVKGRPRTSCSGRAVAGGAFGVNRTIMNRRGPKLSVRKSAAHSCGARTNLSAAPHAVRPRDAHGVLGSDDGDLDGGVEGNRVWMTCTRGAARSSTGTRSVIDRPRSPTPRVLRRRRVSPRPALFAVDDGHIAGIDPQDVKSLLIDVMNFGNFAVSGSSRDTGVAHREQGDTPSLRSANFGARCGGTCRHRSLHEGDRSDHGREAYGTACDQHCTTHCERPNFEHECAPSLG